MATGSVKRVNAYLAFDGRCQEAFRLYEQCLGGRITYMATYGESPMSEQVGPEWQGKIMHATLELGEQVIMGADPPPAAYARPQGFTLMLALDDPAEADRIFGALAEGGEVLMPVQETFWAARFGMLVDRFGVPWQVQCERAV